MLIRESIFRVGSIDICLTKILCCAIASMISITFSQAVPFFLAEPSWHYWSLRSLQLIFNQQFARQQIKEGQYEMLIINWLPNSISRKDKPHVIWMPGRLHSICILSEPSFRTFGDERRNAFLILIANPQEELYQPRKKKSKSKRWKKKKEKRRKKTS